MNYLWWLTGEILTRNSSSNPAPNNGMHPTANQRSFHPELVRNQVECAAGDAGRSASSLSAMTKHIKSQEITCPCCGKVRAGVGGTSLAELEHKLVEANLSPWWSSKAGWSVEEASKGTLQWACRYCLKSGRAIEGNPVVQKFCDYPPYLAYFDVPLRCEDCGSKFVFEAKEQQFWYEELKFWVQSRPKQCAACRKLRRESKRAQNEKRRVG